MLRLAQVTPDSYNNRFVRLCPPVLASMYGIMHDCVRYTGLPKLCMSRSEGLWKSMRRGRRAPLKRSAGSSCLAHLQMRRQTRKRAIKHIKFVGKLKRSAGSSCLAHLRPSGRHV